MKHADFLLQVVVYELTPSFPQGRYTLSLTKLASYRTSTNPLDLAVTPATPSSPATIAVADLMKSLSIVALTPPGSSIEGLDGSANPHDWAMVDVARHFATVWSSSVACIGENEWLLADMEGNLIVLRRNIGGVTAEDQRRLEVTAEFRLGEIVNKIKPIFPTGINPGMAAAASQGKGKTRAGSLTSPTDPNGAPRGDIRTGPLVYPTAFLATVEGGVYLHATISPTYMDPLLRLQAALSARIQAPGHMPWTRYRAPRTEVKESDEPYRVVDGEVLECVLAMDDNLLEEVVGELNLGLGDRGGQMSRDEVRGWVESLKRLY